MHKIWWLKVVELSQIIIIVIAFHQKIALLCVDVHDLKAIKHNMK
jgi:vancomycin permeability regulator SanA